MSDPQIVTGHVRLLEALDQPAGTLYVRVEDVSRADAASEVIAETAITIDRSLAAGEELPFSLEMSALDPRAHYSLRAHLDTTGTRRIDPGDRISTESYPVVTFGNPSEATIVAHKV